METDYQQEISTEEPTNCTSPFSSQEFTNVAIVKTVISSISLLFCSFGVFLIALLRLEVLQPEADPLPGYHGNLLLHRGPH